MARGREGKKEEGKMEWRKEIGKSKEMTFFFLIDTHIYYRIKYS